MSENELDIFNAVFPVQRQRYYRETVILVDQGGSYDINKT